MVRGSRALLALLVVGLLGALIGYAIVTRRRCVELEVVNHGGKELRDIRIRAASEELLSIRSLANEETVHADVCPLRRAGWWLEYHRVGEETRVRTSLNEIYLDFPGDNPRVLVGFNDDGGRATMEDVRR